ncbi:MAG: hypothetical protein ACR2IV_13680 [Bryobacteraceae bacterium]
MKKENLPSGVASDPEALQSASTEATSQWRNVVRRRSFLQGIGSMAAQYSQPVRFNTAAIRHKLL